VRRRATIANPAIECSAWLAMPLRQLSVAVQPTHARMGARTARQQPSLSRRLARAREAATSFRPGRRRGQSAVLPVSCHFAAGEARRRQSRILVVRDRSSSGVTRQAREGGARSQRGCSAKRQGRPVRVSGHLSRTT